MDLEIRDAVPGEEQALEALQLRASLVWEEYRADLEAHPEEISVDEAWIAAVHVRVAERAGGIVGFSVVLPGEDGAVELDGLFVEPELHRGGVGRALVEDAAARAGASGAARMDVIANPRAVGFYERVGFVPVGEIPTKFGPALRMTRRL